MQCAACLESREIAGLNHTLAFMLQRNRMFFAAHRKHSISWAASVTERYSVLEFRILDLKGSVISFTSTSSGGYSGPV